MKNTYLLTILLMLLWPAAARGGQKPDTNVNERYTVESVGLSGVSDSKISRALHDDMHKLVGEKFNQQTSDKLAEQLRKELRGYSITVKVKRGEKPDHVRVVFEAERTWWKRFELPIPPVVYESKEGFSGSIEIPVEIHHNVFTFGLVDNSDELLERNAGIRLRYENRKVGTDLLQARINFDSYHQTFNSATQSALADSPQVPGIYRWRQDFAPSLSLTPSRDVRLSVGTSFQRFQIQYPETHTRAAYAGTADVQYRHRVETSGGTRQNISLNYSLRTATRVLDSEFVYTRHYWNADYSISRHKNVLGVHFRGGLITGAAPLFERFILGNSVTLRGWNKFDVAPLGGARLAYGSLEYSYRPFQIFYDVGAVWDPGHPARTRHSLGFGLVLKDHAFISLGFPVRAHNVSPIFMMGFRY